MFAMYETYSIGIWGGASILGALHFSLDEILNWSRNEEEYAWSLHKLHNFTSNGILCFDYTLGGSRVWHEFSVA